MSNVQYETVVHFGKRIDELREPPIIVLIIDRDVKRIKHIYEETTKLIEEINAILLSDAPSDFKQSLNDLNRNKLQPLHDSAYMAPYEIRVTDLILSRKNKVEGLEQRVKDLENELLDIQRLGELSSNIRTSARLKIERLKKTFDPNYANYAKGSNQVTSQTPNPNISNWTPNSSNFITEQAILESKSKLIDPDTVLKRKQINFHIYGVSDLVEYAETSKLQKNNIYALLILATDRYAKATDPEKKQIRELLISTHCFLTNENKQAHLERMQDHIKHLDSPNCPYWLKVMIGIVLILIMVALLLAAIALVISLTGGSAAAALVAPIITLLKPIVDVVAGISIAGITSGAAGVNAATSAVVVANILGAGIFGLCSFFVMKRPFTDCVMNIINTEEALSK